MKCFFDTNVLLDVLADREPFAKASEAALTRATTGGNAAVASVLSFWNLAYLLRKLFPTDKLRETLCSLAKTAKPADVTSKTLEMAFASTVPDFEDAIQIACAVEAGADVIITRNVAHFDGSPLPVLTPLSFVFLD